MKNLELRVGMVEVENNVAGPGVRVHLRDIYDEDLIGAVVQNFSLARICAAYREYKPDLDGNDIG